MSPANICEYAQGGINQGDTNTVRDVAGPVGCDCGMEGSKVNEELKQAIKDLNYKQRQYFYADTEFEPVAYHELKAAQARVDAIIKEAKEAKAGVIMVQPDRSYRFFRW